MRVTVITPSKNQGRFIEECFRSIHGQTHRDFEHIVLDGMSTDETAEVAAKYPCKFLQCVDTGPAQAINRGLEMATGDVVCWLNADDVFWSKTTLERALGYFIELPKVDVITGNGYFIEEDGRFSVPIAQSPERICHRLMVRGDFMLQPATFWRRNQLRLDESLHYCFDWKLWIDFWQAGLNVIYVPDYFALYRQHTLSLTVGDTARRKREVYGMARRYGGSKIQTTWCWLMWGMYRFSEMLHLPVLKRVARIVNGRMMMLTDCRVMSG